MSFLEFWICQFCLMLFPVTVRPLEFLGLQLYLELILCRLFTLALPEARDTERTSYSCAWISSCCLADSEVPALEFLVSVEVVLLFIRVAFLLDFMSYLCKKTSSLKYSLLTETARISRCRNKVQIEVFY